MRQRAHGFSLIELMIAVVIVGILAAIALPSYGNYVLRANRTVGKTVIMRIAGQQESFFVDRKQYATALNLLSPDYGAVTVYLTRDGKAQTTNSSDTVYSITLTGATATGFTIEATPVNNQTKDTKCGKLSYTNTGTKSAAGSDGANCWKS